MIVATFKEDADRYSLAVIGHAGFAKRGSDIVCAAASILTYTAASMILDLAARGELENEPTLRFESGDTEIVCASGKAKPIYDFVKTGFVLLKENYPKYVDVKTLQSLHI